MARFIFHSSLLSLIFQQSKTNAFLIEDCCDRCNSDNFDNFNEIYLNSKLKELRRRTFFRIFQVNMNKPCTHLAEGTCPSELCQLTESYDEDIPKPWRAITKQEAMASAMETEKGGV